MSDLLQRTARGEPQAVEACVDEYSGLVYRLARRYLDARPGDIDDAVQEVFLAVFMNAGRYDPQKGSEAAFIATLAHRRLIDFQRREVARFAAHERARENASPPPEKISLAEREALAAEFDRLPDDERQAVWFAIYMGMTHQQIAEATGSPLGTVKSRLRRGYLKLASVVDAGRACHLPRKTPHPGTVAAGEVTP